jgi:hypothetical protein
MCDTFACELKNDYIKNAHNESKSQDGTQMEHWNSPFYQAIKLRSESAVYIKISQFRNFDER